MQPFWIDTEYDRDYADHPGGSRYAAYIRQGRFEPYSDDDQAVELAVFAWDRATTPVMSPGYVRRHPRILTARLARSDWDGSLIAQVDLLTGQPAQFRNGLPGPGGGWWRSWPSEHSFMSDRETWYEPRTEELANGAYLLASVSLRFTVPSAGLPQPHPDGADVETCERAVAIVVRELNAIVGPVLARIEES